MYKGVGGWEEGGGVMGWWGGGDGWEAEGRLPFH